MRFIALAALLAFAGCDTIKKKFVENVEQKVRSDLESSQDSTITCPEQFEQIHNVSVELRRAHVEKQVPLQFALSKEDDEKLAKLIEGYHKNVSGEKKAASDADKLYPNRDEKEEMERFQKARGEYVSGLAKELPKYFQKCMETMAKYRAECNQKYAENDAARRDCGTFYARRAYWEMLQLAPSFKEYTEADLKVMRPRLEMTFEEDMAARVKNREEPKVNTPPKKGK